MREDTVVFTNTRSASCQKVSTTGNSGFFGWIWLTRKYSGDSSGVTRACALQAACQANESVTLSSVIFYDFVKNLTRCKRWVSIFLVLRTVVIEHVVDHFSQPIILGFQNNTGTLLDAKTSTRSSRGVVTVVLFVLPIIGSSFFLGGLFLSPARLVGCERMLGCRTERIIPPPWP